MTEPHSFGVVVRSRTHDRTWVAHIGDTDFDNTPAGPLMLVKEEVVRQAVQSGFEGLQWRQPDRDTWVLEYE